MIYRIPIHDVTPGINWRGPTTDSINLQRSIDKAGQKDPIRIATTPDGRCEILDGQRRWTAMRRLGHTHISVITGRHLTGAARALQQLAWHIDGGYTPLAQAKTLAHLVRVEHLPVPHIATSLGTTTRWVTDRITLLRLTPGEQHRLLTGDLTPRTALKMVRRRHNDTPARTPDAAPPPPPRRHQRYWHMGHPLASAAIAACAAAGHTHRNPHTPWAPVSCAPIWEHVIRADERQRTPSPTTPNTTTPTPTLTPRETHAIRLITAGMSQTDTARRLGVSKAFLQRRILLPMIGRLGVTTTIEAVAWAARHHLIPLPPTPHPTTTPITLDNHTTTILRSTAAGHTVRQIANTMNTGERTIINRLQALNKRTGFRSRYQTIAWAIHTGQLP
ncbi:ParB N-terminal domain-containing protein [Micromonospora humidisoli]|uniref:ParB N-terminal domain-containing protein n=1 Tax=Micromonospora humidisoli TaxID=2807622 RepID=UPI00195EC103|nr:ParB N-terminal domain-containing protein [Micromonospora humidisoli]